MRGRFWVILPLMLLTLATLACAIGQNRPPLQPTPTAQPSTTAPAVSFSGVPVNATQAATSAVNNSGTPGTGCTPRSDWPTMVIAEGDTLSSIAAQTGVTVTDLVAANCLTDASSIISGQSLRVPVVPSGSSSGGTSGSSANNAPTSGAPAANNCSGGNDWFFTFAFGGSDSGCPGPVTTVNAVGQNFQGGRVYRYDVVPGEQQAVIYVIYNDGSWTAYPDTWNQGQAADDPSITPPQGWYKPTGALGKLWREQPGVRAKLGWAYGPEDTFQGRLQTSSIPGYTYVDHGFKKYVVQLSQAPKTWRVVGYYP